jgi:fused signal recognition particle receptor
LKKIQRVADQQLSGAPCQVTLVLDATTGQNAIAQAHEFAQSLGVTDIILTKLDGTAKGGVVISISQKLRIPISFICTGEGLEDLEIFDPREFVDAIFA